MWTITCFELTNRFSSDSLYLNNIEKGQLSEDFFKKEKIKSMS